MKKYQKIILSIVTAFIAVFSICFNFFEPLTADAAVVPDDSIVDVSNTSFYNNYYLLESIRSSGSQYIDTGIAFSSSSNVVFDGYNFGSTGYLFGSGVAGSYASGVFVNSSNYYVGRIRTASSSNRDLVSSIKGGTTRHTFSLSRSDFSIDGSSVGSFNSTYNFTDSGTLTLFCMRNGSSDTTSYSSSALYSCKIYSNSTLVRDFVPAQRKSDSVVGLYDLVNSRFYSSSTSTGFVAGSRIYTVNFYNNGSLYDTQSFTSFSDFILPVNPTVSTGNTFVGWSFSNSNDIGSIVSPLSYINSNSNYPLNFYSVIVSDDFLAGYNEAKNIYDGFGPFLYSDYAFVVGSGINSFEVIPTLTGRVAYPDFIGYGGGVVLSDALWSRVDEYEYDNEVDTSLVFTFDTAVPVAKYTNFMFNGNFQYGNSAIFYFNDGTSYTFSSDMGLGNFVDLTSYNTKFITRIRLTYASSIGDYGQGIGLASNPSYLDSYNNGYSEGKYVGYNNGYSTGYREGNTNGYTKGYNAGLDAGSDYSFFGLFGAVLDAPISALKGLLDFQIFGVNLLTLFTGLLTLAIILLVLKLMRGGK